MPLRAKRRQQSPRQRQNAEKVDLHDAANQCVVLIFERTAGPNARVMDNGVERPIRKVEARDKRIHRLGVGHVQTIDPDGSADARRLQLTIELAALCEVAHRRHDAPAAFRQFDRRRKADAGRRPGDEDCSHGVQTSVPKGDCARARRPVRGLPRVRPAAWSAVARANKESPCAG